MALTDRLIGFALVIGLFAALPAPAKQADPPAQAKTPKPALVSYHIGNSLTWDSQPTAVAGMSYIAGIDHKVGYHIRCGSSLVQIAADDKTCVTPVKTFGTWRGALAKHRFDAITIQPHIRSTLGQDQGVVLKMIDAALAGPSTPQRTTFYIYQAWPQTTKRVRKGQPIPAPSDYAELWSATTADKDDTPMAYTAQYFDHLIQRVRKARPQVKVGLIPVGTVFAELDQRLKSGKLKIADYKSANDFYRDVQHLHMNALGRFVAATTVFATLHGKDPTGLAVPKGHFKERDWPDKKIDFDAELLTARVQADLQAVVWEVVSGHRYTGAPSRAR